MHSNEISIIDFRTPGAHSADDELFQNGWREYHRIKIYSLHDALTLFLSLLQSKTLCCFSGKTIDFVNCPEIFVSKQ